VRDLRRILILRFPSQGDYLFAATVFMPNFNVRLETPWHVIRCLEVLTSTCCILIVVFGVRCLVRGCSFFVLGSFLGFSPPSGLSPLPRRLINKLYDKRQPARLPGAAVKLCARHPYLVAHRWRWWP